MGHNRYVPARALGRDYPGAQALIVDHFHTYDQLTGERIDAKPCRGGSYCTECPKDVYPWHHV